MKKQSKLRQMRRKRKLTLETIGEKLGITLQCVSQLERKGINKLTTAERYAEALNCTPLELLG